MSLPVAYGSSEPDPADFADFYDEIQAARDRVENSSITEPFSPDYKGEIIPRDLAMKQYLGEQAAANHLFKTLALARQHVGNTALHYDPDMARWN